MDKPVTPRGINHLVLNVRDIEESHRFWTEIAGFKQVGEIKPTPQRPNPPKMRFYSGVRENGDSHHHDIALVENRDLPAPPAMAAVVERVHRHGEETNSDAARALGLFLEWDIDTADEPTDYDKRFDALNLAVDAAPPAEHPARARADRTSAVGMIRMRLMASR